MEVGGGAREKECNRAEYAGLNQLVMGDKMSQEETEVEECCILMTAAA